MSDYLVFKGKREYLQGASLFDFIQEKLGIEREVQNIDFTMSKMTSVIPELLPKPPEGAINAIGTYRDAGGEYALFETEVPVTGRVTYDESDVAAGFCVSGHTIGVTVGGAYSFMECLIAAFKHLLTAVVFVDEKRKYIFLRVVLNRIPAGDFSVSYSRLIGGRFFEGVVCERDDTLGKIYFTVV